MSEKVCATCGLPVQWWYGGWKHRRRPGQRPSCGKRPEVVEGLEQVPWFEVVDRAGRKIASGPRTYCEGVAERKRGRQVRPQTESQPLDR